MYELTSDFVIFVAGSIIAFLLWWAPGLAPLWAKVPVKRITLIALFLGIPVAFTLLACYVQLPIKVAVVCAVGADTASVLIANILAALKIGLIALSGSQGGYIALVRWAKDLMHEAHITDIEEKVEKIRRLMEALNLTPFELRIIANNLDAARGPAASGPPASSDEPVG